MKRIVIGVGLIVLAVLLFVQNYFDWWHGSFWMIGWSLVLLLLALYSLLRRRWSETVFWLGFSGILLNRSYHFIDVSTGTLFLILLLVTAGIHILFPRSKEYKMLEFLGKNRKVYVKESPQGDHIELTFGSSDKYISDPFERLHAEVAFGTLNLYLNHLEKETRDSTIMLELAFSSMTIYVPKNWQIKVQVDNVFSTISETRNAEIVDGVLYIVGDVAFSNLTIEYV